MNLGEGEDEATEPQAPAKAPTSDQSGRIYSHLEIPILNTPILFISLL